ncbi:tyrosine-type recombinase/integrase [Limnohabitans parvus]|uniref:Integrase n=1 Tax=Limnohabitans parvus II-B4 TaxID=1293052 RepID=A0A315EIW7_9BURK|nr:site-specific integrase [Limnohabitans parvus]PUE55804.1 integrase [Limnohabitans parvus II-B4]
MSQAKTLSENEIQQVLNCVGEKKFGVRDRALVLISHYSGMRVGEIASLTVGHVLDINEKIKSEIRLTAEQTKGKHPRTVFVSSKLKAELANYIQTIRVDDKERALFTTQKSPRRGFTANTLTQHFLNIYKAAGIDGASSHSGRRTYATTIASQGVGLRVLMRLMGHRNVSTTAVYIDANDNMLRNAVELV